MAYTDSLNFCCQSVEAPLMSSESRPPVSHLDKSFYCIGILGVSSENLLLLYTADIRAFLL